MAQIPLRLAALGLASLASLYFGFFAFLPEKQEQLFRISGYYNILILFAGFVISLCFKNKYGVKRWIQKRESLILIGVCLLGATYLYTREGGSFKIVFDEQLLSNVGMNLHRFHEPVITESSLFGNAWYDQIDKRPLFFPFLLSLLHNVTGYNPDNAFYLNFAATTLFLGLLYSLLAKIAGKGAGMYAFALACSMPLIEQNSSGGGFEMLNLCGILTCAWLAIHYQEKPEPKNLASLVLGLALLSHIRYESILIALPVAFSICLSWWKKRKIDIPWPIVLIPLTFLPIAWQFNYIKTQEGYWQYSLKGEGSFDANYLLPNLKSAFNFLFIPSHQYAGSPIIGILGTCSLLALIAFSFTRRKEFYQNRPDRIAFATCALGLLLQTSLILFFTFGQLDNFIVSRLGLPLILLLIISGGIILKIMHKKRQLYRYGAVAIIISASLYASKSYSNPKYTTENKVIKRIESTLNFAENTKPGCFLFISNLARSLELEGYNNIGFQQARNRLEQIKYHIEAQTYDKVFVVEYGTIREKDGILEKKILQSTTLGNKVKLKTVTEQSIGPMNFTRISEIVDIDLDRPDSEEISFPDNDGTQYRKLDSEEQAKWRKSLP